MLRKTLWILPLFAMLLVGCGKDQVTMKESAPTPSASAPAKAPAGAHAKGGDC